MNMNNATKEGTTMTTDNRNGYGALSNAIHYTMTGPARTAMQLSVNTSRAAGHLLPDGVDGGSSAREVRNEIRRDAQVMANTMQKTIEVFAADDQGNDWLVDEVEPA
jgi:hypothetical protein